MPINDDILDASLRHQVGIQRLGAGVLSEILAVAEDAEDRLEEALERRLRRALRRGLDRGPVTTRRVARQLAEIQALINQAHLALGKRLRRELRELSTYEADFQVRMLNGVVPINASYVLPSSEQLHALVTSLPYNGRFFGEHISDLAAVHFRDIAREVQIGVVNGETLDQIVGRVFGSGRLGGVANGKRRRQQIEAVVRTSVNHVASQARELLYKENSDVIKGVMWVSTLDGRTSDVCADLDGEVFEIGTGPRPPAHFRCRSVTTPVVKSWRELGLTGPELSDEVRASMDGEAPAKLTYSKWLRRQPASVQDQVLGRERGRLYRKDPGFDVGRFSDRRGRRLTLEELAKAERALFEEAGVPA